MPTPSPPLLLYAFFDADRTDAGVIRDVCGAAGVQEQPVQSMDAGALTVLASSVPDAERLSSPPVDDVLAFKRIVEAAFDGGPLIPLRFGTVVRSAARVMQIGEEKASAYAKLLDRLEGHVEMGISLTLASEATEETEALETEALETEALETEALETEALETEALETGDGRARLGENGSARSVDSANGEPSYPGDRPGTAYLLARQQQLAKKRRRAEEAAAPFREALSPLATSTSTSPRHDAEDALSLAFLVPREQADPFRRAAENVSSPSVTAAEIVGPWAPYSFV
jgi:hypothetical protein